jgi:AraC-like DNA-binding protein
MSSFFAPADPSSWKKAPISERREKRGTLGPWFASGGADLRWRPPSPALEPFVYGHWEARWNFSEGEPPRPAETLRHPCVNLVAHPSHLEVWGIGLTRWAHDGGLEGRMAGTRFRPGAFAFFSPGPVRLLNDRKVTLAEAFGEAAASAIESVAFDRPVDAYLDFVEEFLIDASPAIGARYELVRMVTESMRETPGEATVDEIARAHGVSVRALQSAFPDYVGVGPKWVLKRYRMHEAVERIATGGYDDAASLATDLGYFDQAHFIRDFKEQVGLSPGAFARMSRMESETATA